MRREILFWKRKISGGSLTENPSVPHFSDEDFSAILMHIHRADAGFSLDTKSVIVTLTTEEQLGSPSILCDAFC